MLNKVILMGRLTKDPELRSTQGGSSVCSFTLAVQRKYAPQGEERKTDFINCTAWRNTAEFISKYFTKGQMMAVEGSIQTRKWETGDEVRYATDVVVSEVEFVEAKKENREKDDFGDELADLPQIGMDNEDDLPY